MGLALLLVACGEKEDGNSRNIIPGNVMSNNTTSNNTTSSNNTNASTNAVSNNSTNATTNNTTANNTTTTNNSTNNGTTALPPEGRFAFTEDGGEVHIAQGLEITYDGLSIYEIKATRVSGIEVTIAVEAIDGPGTFTCAMMENFFPRVSYYRTLEELLWNNEGGDCSVTLTETGGFGGKLIGTFDATLIPVPPSTEELLTLDGEFDVMVPQ
jgi:hypothetical protein